MNDATKKDRFVTLDVLRGFFILVIIVDHLNRFPSLFAWVTGQGRLWVSAGEGFFIISGLLVGYTRGYKKLSLPMKQVTKLLYRRAAVLYLCAVISSTILLILTLHSHFPVLLQPSVVVPKNSLSTAIYQILTLHFVFEWVYFLKFYIASFLFAPLFIWLLRKKQNVLPIVLAFAIWLYGYIIKQDWLQWQVLFFVPAVFGFHLTAIRKWWRGLASTKRKVIEYGLVGTTALSFLISSFWVFGWELVKGPRSVMSFETYVNIRHTIDPFFYKVQLSIGRVLLALVCFAGFYLIVNRLWPHLERFLGWLLIPFGKNSLRAYIIHGFVLLPLQVFMPLSLNTPYNTLLGIVAVMTTYVLCLLPPVKRLIPT